MFDWILRGQYEEGFGQAIGLATDCDFVLLHRFQQSRLSLGWCAVDFVSQQQLREHRSALEDQFTMPSSGRFLDDIGARDVSRHEIWRELDAMKGQGHRFGQRAHHQSFGQARYTFQEAMAARQHGDQKLFDDFILTNDDLGNLLTDLGAGFAQALGTFEYPGRWPQDLLQAKGNLPSGTGAGVSAAGGSPLTVKMLGRDGRGPSHVRCAAGKTLAHGPLAANSAFNCYMLIADGHAWEMDADLGAATGLAFYVNNSPGAVDDALDNSHPQAVSSSLVE